MKQVLLIGSGGFIGSSLRDLLIANEYRIFQIDRGEFEARIQSRRGFRDLANQETLVVFCAAKVPVRTLQDYVDNTMLVKNFIDFFQVIDFDYLLNIGSDAIYADSDSPLTERSITSPQSLHGVMHFMREAMLNEVFHGKIGHVRSTLVYGPKDTHNGYGPNRFIRQAISRGTFEIFGQGEEIRDHIFIDDLCQIARFMLDNKCLGTINAASGHPISFREIGNVVQTLVAGCTVKFIKRASESLPHGGFRIFDTSLLNQTFPQIHLCPPELGLKLMFERLSSRK
jgi:nucleoside-diphosphate-sugar epimerase